MQTLSLLKFTVAIKIECLFHFGQCLWREIQSLGLRNKYTTNDTFRMNVKKLMALAFLPVSDVTKGIQQLLMLSMKRITPYWIISRKSG